MKVLVTGGCGFLGSHVCETFRKEGWEVISYDNLTKYELGRTGYGTERTREFNRDFLQKLGCEMVKADVCDEEALRDYSSGCSFLVHTAAQPAMTISWEDPRLDFNTNVLGTFNVLDAARIHRIPVVNTSSIHVYGNSINNTLTEGPKSYERNPVAIDENHPVMIGEISPLHASKMSAEHYVRTFTDMLKTPAATFRYTGIYGPRQFGGEDHGWVANFAIRSTFGLPLRIFGTGKQARDILFAEDGARAYLDYYKNPVPGVYNIGGGPESKISLLECIDLLGDVLGKKLEVEMHAERPGDMRYFVCDITKASANFQFKPAVRPREGVEKLLKWIEENKIVFEIKN